MCWLRCSPSARAATPPQVAATAACASAVAATGPSERPAQRAQRHRASTAELLYARPPWSDVMTSFLCLSNLGHGLRCATAILDEAWGSHGRRDPKGAMRWYCLKCGAALPAGETPTQDKAQRCEEAAEAKPSPPDDGLVEIRKLNAKIKRVWVRAGGRRRRGRPRGAAASSTRLRSA